jgi:hypothetical protein
MSDRHSKCRLLLPIVAIDGKGKFQWLRHRLVERARNQPYLVAPGKLTVQKLSDFEMTSSHTLK